ncbi:hypothetical protein ABIC60_001007 [Phyllobacterium ifriqiyense]
MLTETSPRPDLGTPLSVILGLDPRTDLECPFSILDIEKVLR